MLYYRSIKDSIVNELLQRFGAEQLRPVECYSHALEQGSTLFGLRPSLFERLRGRVPRTQSGQLVTSVPTTAE